MVKHVLGLVLFCGLAFADTGTEPPDDFDLTSRSAHPAAAAPRKEPCSTEMLAAANRPFDAVRAAATLDLLELHGLLPLVFSEVLKEAKVRPKSEGWKVLLHSFQHFPGKERLLSSTIATLISELTRPVSGMREVEHEAARLKIPGPVYVTCRAAFLAAPYQAGLWTGALERHIVKSAGLFAETAKQFSMWNWSRAKVILATVPRDLMSAIAAAQDSDPTLAFWIGSDFESRTLDSHLPVLKALTDNGHFDPELVGWLVREGNLRREAEQARLQGESRRSSELLRVERDQAQRKAKIAELTAEQGELQAKEKVLQDRLKRARRRYRWMGNAMGRERTLASREREVSEDRIELAFRARAKRSRAARIKSGEVRPVPGASTGSSVPSLVGLRLDLEKERLKEFLNKDSLEVEQVVRFLVARGDRTYRPAEEFQELVRHAISYIHEWDDPQMSKVDNALQAFLSAFQQKEGISATFLETSYGSIKTEIAEHFLDDWRDSEKLDGMRRLTDRAWVKISQRLLGRTGDAELTSYEESALKYGIKVEVESFNEHKDSTNLLAFLSEDAQLSISDDVFATLVTHLADMIDKESLENSDVADLIEAVTKLAWKRERGLGDEAIQKVRDRLFKLIDSQFSGGDDQDRATAAVRNPTEWTAVLERAEASAEPSRPFPKLVVVESSSEDQQEIPALELGQTAEQLLDEAQQIEASLTDLDVAGEDGRTLREWIRVELHTRRALRIAVDNLVRDERSDTRRVFEDAVVGARKELTRRRFTVVIRLLLDHIFRRPVPVTSTVATFVIGSVFDQVNRASLSGEQFTRIAEQVLSLSCAESAGGNLLLSPEVRVVFMSAAIESAFKRPLGLSLPYVHRLRGALERLHQRAYAAQSSPPSLRLVTDQRWAAVSRRNREVYSELSARLEGELQHQRELIEGIEKQLRELEAGDSTASVP